MPSRKQRRRRQKSRRHEYEYVYVDDEGREVEVDPAELRKEREDKPSARGGAAARTARGRGGARAGRKVDPPSWSRVGRRALIFAPLMFITVTLLGRKLTVTQRITETLFLLLFFLPFSYVMDTIVYRSYLRRTGQAPPSRRRGASNGDGAGDARRDRDRGRDRNRDGAETDESDETSASDASDERRDNRET